ncbi:beta-galactosidase [Dethiosulfatibacter aminovorans DSM 17477]|uniref:Beta-galactosidase n=1 Tax=Dethiosulfatibacter aminovorans DSM 17477 TaxID=1121476 RepID=A0A1M6EN69_9FIRM|nr:glycoside hydrolase family 2 TIM barrel-domain containing protein [Dethiosulfatibacter aminovorans]SHI86904.1 beta-galactosidase [Dethiosulfatibacter aminovorans DSM 17477]
MKRKLFNENWVFGIGTGTSMDHLFGIGSDIEPKSVTLPHDAMILTERKNSKEGASLGFYKGQNYNYTKEFELSEEDSDKVIWMEFEGVYQDAFVYVNESFVGRCNYGYGNYYLNLTDFVFFGKTNKIIVVVKNEGRSGRWYTGGGIYRDINIMMGNQLYIACEGTKITPTDVEQDLAVINIETPLNHIGAKLVSCTVLHTIYDADGNMITSDKAPITILGNENTTLKQRLYVRKPKMWNTDTPYLYSCKTIVTIGEEIIDEYETRFGIRKIQLDIDHGLRINGETIKLRGGCVHHDNGVVGTATFDRAEYRRVRKLKEAGFNALRSGAHPMSRAMLEACDELGLLVIDEFTDVFNNVKVDFDYGSRFDLFWEIDLMNMVKRDYNHPSVIMYSLGCENPQIANRIDKRLIKKMKDTVQSFDTTRYITNDVNMMLIVIENMAELMANNPLDSKAEVNSTMNNFGEMLNMLSLDPRIDERLEEGVNELDVFGYNYALNRYEHDTEKYPNRILMATECTMLDLEKTWEYTNKYNHVLGDFCWSAWDYLGEAGVGRTDYEEFGELDFYAKWPWRLACSGAIDIIGDRKTISYWREMIWGRRMKPYIAVRDPKHYREKIYKTNWAWISDAHANWTWKDCENKPVTIEVLSPAEEVELFLNGKSVGKKKTGEELTACAIFETLYEPGELKVVDSNGEEFVLRSAVDDTHIAVHVEGEKLKSGGCDVAFLEIGIVDHKGRLNAGAEKLVSIKVEGEGTLQGFGSAHPKSLENYYDVEFTTYRGRLLAVVRSGMNPGEILVTISAENCDTQHVKIEVI